jgi:hypothetical protein
MRTSDQLFPENDQGLQKIPEKQIKIVEIFFEGCYYV